MARSLVSSFSISFNIAASICDTDGFPKQIKDSSPKIFKKTAIHAHIFSKNVLASHPENHLQFSFLASKASKFGRKNSGALLCRGGQIYNVEIEHEGKKHILQVPEDETILSNALDAGLQVPHDCKLGVCMTCPAKLVSGKVDQSEGMLSDDVIEKGYALMCASYPRSDCSIRTIPEDELLSLQLVTAST